MAVETLDVFFAVLGRSGLFEASEFDDLRRLVGDLEDPKAIARKLVSAGKLSRWQAGQLLEGRFGLRFTMMKRRPSGSAGGGKRKRPVIPPTM